MGVQGNFFNKALEAIFLLLSKTLIGLSIIFSISTTSPFVPSKPLSENFLLLCLMRDMRFVLLNDLPLENKYIDSSKDVLPDPLDP
jgi:hypothetical protein